MTDSVKSEKVTCRVELLYQQRINVEIPVEEMPAGPDSAKHLIKNHDPEFIAEALPTRYDGGMHEGLTVLDIKEVDALAD